MQTLNDRTMKVAETIEDSRQAVAQFRKNGRLVGLVPTMGALHEGHWSLVEQAGAECDAVVVSIFLNPLQFGTGEDFDHYPRTLEADLKGCEDRGVSLVFCPSGQEMYPGPIQTRVHVDRLTEKLCGRFRPGHFDGVCTVVSKLFNIVGPDKAYFGEKDYQQLTVIRRMVRDLNMPLEIVGCPTVREEDGLAMSSRNAFLSVEQRKRAAVINQALFDARDAIAEGERDADAVIETIESRIRTAGAKSIDYVSIVDPVTLKDVEVVDGPARICVAAYFGEARLIDNVAVDGSATGR